MRGERLLRCASAESGVVMVEGTLGIALLLVVALLALQLVLVTHASLAAQTAAYKSARIFTITGGELTANDQGGIENVQKVMTEQQRSAMQVLQWRYECGWEPGAGWCTVDITVPVIVPGGTLLGDHGLRGPLAVHAKAWYPYGENSGL